MNRKDGIKVKNADGLHSLISFIMPKRCDADVYVSTKVDCTNLVKYMEKIKKKDKDSNLTYFHLFSTAIAKVIYNKPLMNRFVINKTLYDRKFVSLSFVAKKEFTDSAEETLTAIKVDKDDNLTTISEKISGKVKGVRTNKTNAADNFINNVGKFPKFVRWLMIRLLKFADNHDLIPASLTQNSIYHQTVLLSNLGSIGCNEGIYHHLTDLGTNSILLTIGKIKDEPSVVDGKIEIRKMCEFGITLDERIADGFYFIKACNLFAYILENPELLEENVNVRVNQEKNK